MRLILQAMRCMSKRLDSSINVNDNIYVKSMFQLEASLWLIDNLRQGRY